MDKKIIQKRRMMKYFIEATEQIVEKESFDSITVRKISDLAGFNSSTIYNYFKNLDELIYFSCIKYLEYYIWDLPNYIDRAKNSYEIYINIWRCFCHHSFKNPKIYFHMFFFSQNISPGTIKEYFEIFPEKIYNQSKYLLPMLLGENLYDRNLSLLKECINKENLTNIDLDELNEMTILIYESMLYNLLNKTVDYSINTATEKTIKYIDKTLDSYTNNKI